MLKEHPTALQRLVCDKVEKQHMLLTLWVLWSSQQLLMQLQQITAREKKLALASVHDN